MLSIRAHQQTTTTSLLSHTGFIDHQLVVLTDLLNWFTELPDHCQTETGPTTTTSISEAAAIIWYYFDELCCLNFELLVFNIRTACRRKQIQNYKKETLVFLSISSSTVALKASVANSDFCAYFHASILILYRRVNHGHINLKLSDRQAISHNCDDFLIHLGWAHYDEIISRCETMHLTPAMSTTNNGGPRKGMLLCKRYRLPTSHNHHDNKFMAVF